MRSRPGGSGDAHSAPQSEAVSAAGSVRSADGADQVAAAKTICLRLLTVRARSRFELAAKLRDKGIADEAATAALDRLAVVRLVDDLAFAEAFVRSRHRDRGLGRSALRLELGRKGIDRDVIERALEQIDDGDERERAAALVAKKLDSALLHAGPQAARRRLLAMLARRGYSSAVAIEAVGSALRGFVEEWPEAQSEP